MFKDEEKNLIAFTIIQMFNEGLVEITCTKCKKITIPECPKDLEETVCCGVETIIKDKNLSQT